MSIYIIAQCIGLIGYIFYVAAPHFKTQNKIMHIEMIACAIIAIQWYFLDQHTLVVKNLFLAGVTPIILCSSSNQKLKNILPILYPIGIIGIFYTATGTITDVIALFALLATLRTKLSENITEFRILSCVTGLTLTLAGAITSSIPALIFNLIFASGHLRYIAITYHKNKKTYAANA